jgi:TolA-binding protein
MATARRPFIGTTASDLITAIVNQLPTSPRVLNPDVPLELDRIITKALEKNPALRYQTASDLRSDLQRLTRDLDRASSLQPQPTRRASLLASMRSRSWLRTSSVVGISVVAGTVWLAFSAVKAWSGSAASSEETKEPMRVADVELRPAIERPKPVATPVLERSTPAAPARQDAPPARAVAAAASRPAPPAATDPPASPAIDQFEIARQQIDLKLYDQAIDGLRKVAQGSHRQKAIDASFLIASVQRTRGDVANAMSTYIEIANRFPEDPRAAEALVGLAESTLTSKGRDKEQDARRTLTELVQKYPESAWAPRALVMRGDLEARQGTYQRDEILGGSVPTAAVTYREVVERYASSDVAVVALNKLAHIYTDMKRFDIAAATYDKLAARDGDDRFDAWFAAGEIYEKRLKDTARARASYSRVLPSSLHYAEARKRIGSK